MDLNRRKLLSAMGLAGVGAFAGGQATSALYSDQETAKTTFAAGDLDIQIDWKAQHNGVVFNEGGPENVDGKLIAEFLDVKPCDEGCVSLSVHNPTNPAYVFAAFELVDDNDNFLTEPEMEAEDTDETFIPEDGSTTGDGCFFGGKLEGWDKENEEFTVIENGQLTDQYNEYIFMVEADEKNHEKVRVKLRVKETNSESELLKYSLESLTDGCGICKVDTKSGTAEETTDFGSCVSGETETVTTPGTNTNDDLQGISNIEVWVCNTSEDPGEPQTDDDGELDECIETRFFEDPDQDCVPENGVILDWDTLRNHIDGSGITKADGGIQLGEIGTKDQSTEETKWYSLDWELPCECGNETQSDSFGLNIYFYAEQVRNNPDPDPPW